MDSSISYEDIQKIDINKLLGFLESNGWVINHELKVKTLQNEREDCFWLTKGNHHVLIPLDSSVPDYNSCLQGAITVINQVEHLILRGLGQFD